MKKTYKPDDPRRVVAYVGYRGGDAARVLRLHADGTASALPVRLDLRRHSPDGFEWGYRGSGPAQLALALLADRLGEADGLDYAMDVYQDFKFAVVSRWDRDTWLLPAAEIDDWLAGWRSYQVADGGDLRAERFAEGGAA